MTLTLLVVWILVGFFYIWLLYGSYSIVLEKTLIASWPAKILIAGPSFALLFIAFLLVSFTLIIFRKAINPHHETEKRRF